MRAQGGPNDAPLRAARALGDAPPTPAPHRPQRRADALKFKDEFEKYKTHNGTLPSSADAPGAGAGTGASEAEAKPSADLAPAAPAAPTVAAPATAE